MTNEQPVQRQPDTPASLAALALELPAMAMALGFQSIGITDIDPGEHATHLDRWLAADFHGDMDYMARHANLRKQPELLMKDVKRVISVRMNYLSEAPRMPDHPDSPLLASDRAYVARYALGRDYHKLMRKRLSQLAKQIDARLQPHAHRACVDSAPVLERGLAQKAGMGWVGKNTMLISREAGSFFFLGEILTSAPLPMNTAYADNHCGRCQACLSVCPTQAFTGPYQLDARRCISYLTIEYKGSIDPELRPLMGNRIFGCDDCQLVCPWNRFSQLTDEGDFQPRHQLNNSDLVDLFLWDENTFMARTEGSAIRRTGYISWLRNLAIALGNAPGSPEILAALQQRAGHPNQLVREHVDWALQQHSA